ncbi:MAG: signal peptidase I [Verrucomicrobia bacterium]|jgi:signal peptidase I|nr:signal peptidase I [Verrucomicrobiota bacterium]
MNADMPFNSGSLTGARAASAASSNDAARGKIPLRRQLMQCGVVAVLALAGYLIISHLILQSVRVVGVSMSPTLKNSGFYLLNRCVYLVRNPQPNDIVVIRDPLDQSYSVKRIIAGAGDSVYITAGRVYVNGRELAEPYLSPNTPTWAYERQPEKVIRCRQDEYFLLGDNRLNSTDSRAYGPVPRQNILGAIIH